MLQMGLFKWGLEYEPKHSRYWRAFRSLFLLVDGYDVAKRYQHPEYCAEWERKYKPQVAQ